MLRPCFHKKKIVFWPPFSVLCTGHTHREKKTKQNKKKKKKKKKKTVECPSQEHSLKSSTFHFTSHSSTPLNFAIVPEGGTLCKCSYWEGLVYEWVTSLLENRYTPKIRLEAYMLVNGCLQPILMIGKIKMSPSRNVGLFSLANYAVWPWRFKRTYNFAINCSETDSLVDKAEDCNVRGSGFESWAKHFSDNFKCFE